jgi:hypothetical protein
VRTSIVILILVGYLLSLAGGRAETVWHDELAVSSVDAIVEESQHDHDHPEHPAVNWVWEHDHSEDVPEHSHVPAKRVVDKFVRCQHYTEILFAPSVCSVIDNLLACIIDPFVSRFPPTQFSVVIASPPLAGSTTHLLF